MGAGGHAECTGDPLIVKALQHRSFLLLWSGMTISAVGDGMSLVVFVWLAFQLTHSSAAVAGVVIAYSAPVLVGGLATAAVLDRFSRRNVLLMDNLIRGAVFGCIAASGLTHHFALWQLTVGAATYGSLKMISLAGVPAMIPSLVPAELFGAANALESLGFQAAAVVGPALGGVALAVVGGFSAIAWDAATYFVFAACLVALGKQTEVKARRENPASGDLVPALRFITRAPAMIAVTIMFMCFNIMEGGLSVLLPSFTATTLGSGAVLYSGLLTIGAVASVVATVMVGSMAPPLRLGLSIAVCQILAGLSILGLLYRTVPFTIAAYAAIGLFAGPLTVWAQTLRMRIIPPTMRGRVFAILRTFMQATPPIGAGLVALTLPRGGLTVAIAMLGGIAAFPAVAALALRSLVHDRPDSIEG
ncbi:MAG: MFS transporter [Candidatus Eremiobacteraeota bacterium]|nr:MFS transporter [Candidatus Eremiobacteraeota bacterium]